MKFGTNIRLKKAATFSDIERLAEILISSGDAKFQIPNVLSTSGAMGIESAALQLLATWLRAGNHHVLHTAVTDTSGYEALCQRLFGLCALRLSDTILTAKKEEVSLAIALAPAISTFTDLRSERYESAYKGLYVALPSVKSIPTKNSRNREFDLPLYNGESIASSKKFFSVTSNVLKSVLPGKTSRVADDFQFVEHLSEILRELFSNTHKHARVDEKGNPYSKNFRAITFQTVKLTRDRMLSVSVGNSPRSSMFIGDWLPNQDETFQVLEINIVDSGPGLARRWVGLSKEDLSEEDEKASILKCFEKHASTDKQNSSGSGLSNVLKDVKKLEGWFRMRSGRAVVEKIFFKKGGYPEIEKKDIYMQSSFLEGTAVTIVIPLESIKRNY